MCESPNVLSPHTQEILRDYQCKDHDTIKKLAKQCFPVTLSLFVSSSKYGGKVIEVDGKIAAAVLVDIIKAPSGKKFGQIIWALTDPAFRGRGFAKKLIAAATLQLRDVHNCVSVVTEIEGFNTPSANAFLREGYNRFSFFNFARRYGFFDACYVWSTTGIAVDPGNHYWVDSQSSPFLSSYFYIMITILLHFIIGLLNYSFGSAFSFRLRFPSLMVVSTLLIGISVPFLLRLSCFKLVSYCFGVPLEFRAWSGGWIIVVIVWFFYGQIFPLPGSMYPKGDGWKTLDHRKLYGVASIINFVIQLLLYTILRFTASSLDSLFQPVVFYLISFGSILLLFDTLFAVAPLEGFNSRHLRDFSKPIWILFCLLYFFAAIGLKFYFKN
ncbi:hypothetical protein P9112_010972 [Eukaryota sp. TZLM1-RC]